MLFANILQLWLRRLVLLLICATATVLLVHVPAGYVETRGPEQTMTVNGRIVTTYSVDRQWLWSAYQQELGLFRRQVLAQEFPYFEFNGKKQFLDLFAPAWRNTVRLFATAGGIGSGLGLLIGSLYALRSRLPRAVSFLLSTIGVSLPDFLVVVAGQAIAIWSYWELSFRPWLILADPDSPRGALLPIITLALIPMGFLGRITAAVLDEVMLDDYIRTARSKGLPEWKVIFGHALRNALPRIFAAFPAALSLTISSLLVVERLTVWPGIVRWVVPRYFRLPSGHFAGEWLGATPQIVSYTLLLCLTCFILLEGLSQSLYVLTRPRSEEVEL